MSSLEILRGRIGGQIAAILHKVCGAAKEKLDALLRDEVEVRLVERDLKLFDKNGRRIPKDLKFAVCNADKDFYLTQPIINYADWLIRFQKAFKEGPAMSAAEFEGRSDKLITEIQNNKNICNLLNGVHLPIILPKLENFVDYGKTLEDIFLPAVKFSYEEQFLGRKFFNYRENSLAGKVIITPDARHERLIKKMKQDYVVAIYFPNPLQGFSNLASREQMATLPESLILAGGFDIVSAIVMYPDILFRDYHTPGYDLSALVWQSPVCSLYFGASGDVLCFDDRGGLGRADGYDSSGLLFLGSA